MSFYPLYKEQFNLLSSKQKYLLDEIPHLEEIEGWLLLSEAIELFGLSSNIKSNNPIICEIGVWKGKSSYIFASAIKNKNGILYSIDPFTGEGDSMSRDTYQEGIRNMNTTLLGNFETTLNKYKLREYIRILPMLSEEAHKKFTEPRIDLLFIDGNHEYEFVKKDYKLWSPLIPSGGIIILHDVLATHVDGPKQIMQEYIINKRVWKDVRIVGEMCIATKV